MATFFKVLAVLAVVLFGIAIYGIYRVYRTLKKVERDVIQEVSHTKQQFEEVVTNVLSKDNDDDQPPKRKVVEDAEEIQNDPSL